MVAMGVGRRPLIVRELDAPSPILCLYRPAAPNKATLMTQILGVEIPEVTLPGKVDAPEEASLPWGVQDVQEKKSKTFHERVQG